MVCSLQPYTWLPTKYIVKYHIIRKATLYYDHIHGKLSGRGGGEAAVAALHPGAAEGREVQPRILRPRGEDFSPNTNWQLHTLFTIYYEYIFGILDFWLKEIVRP